MPKAEKENRKDIESMQQEVKRKVVDPGVPSDVGLWPGAILTKYRWLSNLCPTFALEFVANLCHNVTNSKLGFLKEVPSFVDICNKLLSHPLEENLLFGFICIKYLTHSLTDTLLLESTILKNIESFKDNSLQLEDECTPNLNP